MKAVNPRSTFEYVLRSERDLPKSEQTIFVCSFLTVEQEAKLEDCSGYQSENGYVLTIGSSNLMALHLGLKEIINMPDADGNTPVLKRDETYRKDYLPGVGRPWKINVLEQIESDARAEIAIAIKRGASITADEAKYPGILAPNSPVILHIADLALHAKPSS